MKVKSKREQFIDRRNQVRQLILDQQDKIERLERKFNIKNSWFSFIVLKSLSNIIFELNHENEIIKALKEYYEVLDAQMTNS